MKKSDIFLSSPRLILQTAIKEDCPGLEKVFSPWESSTTKNGLDYRDLIKRWNLEFEEGRSIRFLLTLKESVNNEIIGICNFTQVMHGPFHACYLGYNLDKNYEGLGLMSEALNTTIPYMFKEQNIHRIMANYMPTNARSGKLLRRLGFIVEGYARDYLFINGSWEDHILTSLTNPETSK